MRKSVQFVVLLIGGFIALQMIADITATKFMTIAGVTMPAGTLVFALVFTWRDIIHKQLGREWARAAIITAAGVNVFMALYFWFTVQTPPAVWWGNQEAYATVLALVPRITLASIVAELVSGMVDTEVYHALMHRIPERHQWARVLLSNAASLPIDSAIFGLVAFAGIEPLWGILAVINGQFVFKMLVTVVSLPLIYLVPGRREPMVFAIGD